jgi:hypothetical protein
MGTRVRYPVKVKEEEVRLEAAGCSNMTINS